MTMRFEDPAADFIPAVQRVFGTEPRVLDGSRAVLLGDVKLQLEAGLRVVVEGQPERVELELNQVRLQDDAASADAVILFCCDRRGAKAATAENDALVGSVASDLIVDLGGYLERAVPLPPRVRLQHPARALRPPGPGRRDGARRGERMTVTSPVRFRAVGTV